MIARLAAAILMIASAGLTACGLSTSSAPGPTDSAVAGGVAPQGGDIPDNQVYLTYAGSGFSVQYPEGWVRTARSDGVTFQDKDNLISVVILNGVAPTVDSVRSEVRAISGATMTTDAHQVSLPAGPAIAATYQVDGSADPVTGKRPRLTVDRYELSQGGRLAVLELGNRLGDDNVDAYRMIAQSFGWR